MAFSTSVKANAAAGVRLGTPASPGGPLPAAGPGPGGWHPTILYMVALVAAEIIAVTLLSRYILR
jgi:hypothetical protein